MKLIVGLGNPGKKYDRTRHNIGFMMIDNYISFKGCSGEWKNKFNSTYFQTEINGNKVIFLKPSTYMNLSGTAVSNFINYFKIDINDILVISDDLDLLVGNYKLKESGSSGGHNGIKNIIECLNTDKFKRLKIGISKSNDINTKDYVLGKISDIELARFGELFNTLNSIIDEFFILDFSILMSKYNHKNR